MRGTTSFLRTQLKLRRHVERRRLEAIGHEPTLEDEPWDYYAHRRALEVIAGLESELADRDERP